MKHLYYDLYQRAGMERSNDGVLHRLVQYQLLLPFSRPCGIRSIQSMVPRQRQAMHQQATVRCAAAK